MKRVVIKDRRGDVNRGPMNFEDEASLASYIKLNAEGFARHGQSIVELPPSKLTPEGCAMLSMVDQLANQANGITKHFTADRDFIRRHRNMTPTKADVKLEADALRVAADLLEELSAKEYGL